MKNIKINFGPNAYRDNEPKIPKLDFSAEFDTETEGLSFASQLNTLVQNFIAHIETFKE